MTSALAALGGCAGKPATGPDPTGTVTATDAARLRPPVDIPAGATAVARREFERLAKSVAYIHGQIDAAEHSIPNRCHLDNDACARSWNALGALLRQIDPSIFHFAPLCTGSSKWSKLHQQRVAAHLEHMKWRRKQLDDLIAERLGDDAARARFEQMRAPDPLAMARVCLSCDDW